MPWAVRSLLTISAREKEIHYCRHLIFENLALLHFLHVSQETFPDSRIIKCVAIHASLSEFRQYEHVFLGLFCLKNKIRCYNAVHIVKSWNQGVQIDKYLLTLNTQWRWGPRIERDLWYTIVIHVWRTYRKRYNRWPRRTSLVPRALLFPFSVFRGEKGLVAPQIDWK